MTLQIGQIAPDFEQDSTAGRIRFHEWIGDSWCVLFSHPKDFTPVCTTELGAMARLRPEFDERNCRIIGLSVDSAEDHAAWKSDIAKATGSTPDYPMIADTDLNVARLYGMLPATTTGTAKGRTAQDNATVRTVFIIAPDKTIRAMLIYPMSSGRNFDEVLRLLDSLQLTARHKVATPVNWKQGDDVIILPSIPDEEARKIFPDWRAPTPYLRYVPQPNG
jgi:alkyl hydroperoxide reductase subunit AhpC